MDRIISKPVARLALYGKFVVQQTGNRRGRKMTYEPTVGAGLRACPLSEPEFAEFKNFQNNSVHSENSGQISHSIQYGGTQ
jgi:hypothetical protein